jgi:hypothetical protein
MVRWFVLDVHELLYANNMLHWNNAQCNISGDADNAQCDISDNEDNAQCDISDNANNVHFFRKSVRYFKKSTVM